MKNKYLAGWGALVSIVSLILVAINVWWFNPLEELLRYDSTFISLGIFCLFAANSISIGFSFFSEREMVFEKFITDELVSLGLIGTIIGLITVLYKGFTTFNLLEVETAALAIGVIASGMGTAMITTFMGLVCSMILRLQMLLLEKHRAA